jgi:hypothetical protein
MARGDGGKPGAAAAAASLPSCPATSGRRHGRPIAARRITGSDEIRRLSPAGWLAPLPVTHFAQFRGARNRAGTAWKPVIPASPKPDVSAA